MRTKKHKTKISPLQRFARRRNYEKNQVTGMHKELEFRLNARWMASSLRSQTQTDEEINKLRAITFMLKDILDTWDENTSKSKLNINFNKYM